MDKKISELDLVSTLDTNDVLPIVNQSITKKVKVSQLTDGLASTTYVNSQDDLKVDKVTGKGLSTEDYTTDEKNKLTSITGTNTGDQTLQQVTNLGASTTNPITVTANTSGNGLVVTNTGVGNTIVAISNNTGDGGEYAIKAYSYNGVGAAGYFYSDATEALAAYCDSAGGYALNLYSIGGGSKITALADIVQELNQSLNNKGLVINSGTSSTGNFIELVKNGINKLTVNQAGDVSANKFIKSGGTSSQFLKADGSIDSNAYATGTGTATGTNTGDNAVNSLYSGLESSKANVNSPTFTGTVTTPSIIVSNETASTLASFDTTKNLKSLNTTTYPNLTEISYVKGLTSNAQNQLNALKLEMIYLDSDDTYFDAYYIRTVNAGATFENSNQLLSTMANLRSISYVSQGFTQQINADKFVKLGGTSEKYLMADGSALSNVATNTTTSALTLATLNSTYPTAIIGFRVHCISITAGKLIYEKTSTGWISYSITIIT